MDINEKLDLILKILKDFSTRLEKNIADSNTNFNQIDKKFDTINKQSNEFENRINCKFDELYKEFDKKFNELDEKFDEFELKNDEQHKFILDKLESLKRRVDILTFENQEAHGNMINSINSLDNSFLKFETESNDKIRILFDENQDRKYHQEIYNRKFNDLNNIVLKNSYKISQLEKVNN